MQTWAQRGLRTALVTGGLLMLGTSIASANENVNPDRPASPLDSGALGSGAGQLPAVPQVPVAGPDKAVGVAAASPLTEEAQSLNNMYSTAGERAGDVTTTSEWGVLSGDLLSPPVGEPRLPASGGAVRAPVDLFGQVVDGRRLDPAGAEEFGPSALADSLLRANQVPLLSDLFTVPRVPGLPLPVNDVHATQIMPAVPDFGTELPVQQKLPVAQPLPVQREVQREVPREMPRAVPAPRALPRRQDLPQPRPVPFARQDMPVAAPFQRMSGELPVAGSLPTRPANVSLPARAANLALPDLPPVPTLPAMPALHSKPSVQDAPAALPPIGATHLNAPSLPSAPRLSAPQVSMPHVSAPLAGGLPVGQPATQPATQDVPAGAAQQLMAQLRGLISELENAGSGNLHPMNVTELQEPPML